MTQSAATRPANLHSLLPADGQGNNDAQPGFLARLEADGGAPAVTRPPKRSRLPMLSILVLLALVVAGAAILWLQPNDSPSVQPAVTRQTVDATTAPRRQADSDTVPEDSPVSDDNIALSAILGPPEPSIATITPFTELNADIDALAQEQAKDELPASTAGEWQPEGFATTDAVSASALADIPMPQPAVRHRRSRRTDSDAELLEMLMRRLDQGDNK